MQEKNKDHIRLESDAKVILATGLGGAGREYPDYYAKFGAENVAIVYWDETCTDVDSHISKLKNHIPKEEPFVAVGLSMGGCLWLELMNRERLPNQKGLVLVGCSRKVKGDQGLEFFMKLPWWFIWVGVILLTILSPIMLFVWRKKTIETYQELWGFVIKDGARKIHRQYNLTLKSLGAIECVQDCTIPLVIVRLKRDTLVDEEDLEYTKTMFNNVHEQFIEIDALHLTEKYDNITVEKIGLEAEFLGMLKYEKNIAASI